MKQFLPLVAGFTAMIASAADAQQPNVAGRRFSPEQVRSVAPALEKHTQERLYGAVWNRPGLNHRDRSLITMAALIARPGARARLLCRPGDRERRQPARDLRDHRPPR